MYPVYDGNLSRINTKSGGACGCHNKTPHTFDSGCWIHTADSTYLHIQFLLSQRPPQTHCYAASLAGTSELPGLVQVMLPFLYR